jgi:hypothetical protein
MSNESDLKKKRLEDLVWMFTNISREDLSNEPELLLSKWFDYRFLSPLEATRRFVDAYRRQYKSEYAREIDYAGAAEVDGVRIEHLFNHAKMRTQIWRARQRADATGMPYDFYMQASFSFAARRSVTTQDGKTRARMLLSISQLHHPERAAEAWDDYRENFWGDRVDVRAITMPDDPAYRIEYFQDLPAQKQFREWWANVAAASTSAAKSWMEHFFHVKQQIPVEAFQGPLGEARYLDQLDQMQAEVRRSFVQSEAKPELYATSAWQSCFGMVGSVPVSPTCSHCPQAAKCTIMQGLADKALIASAGSADPVRTRKLQLHRARQRRYRNKLDAGSGVPSRDVQPVV